MPKIQLLDKQTAELIAAGEVVERPASAVKELVENAVDAGATQITVKIENGGVSLISVTDNGCGISREDVPTAFMRHATSKIRKESDLDRIGTLGFRGEALAAVSAVSRVTLITRRQEDEYGTVYRINGGEEQELDDIGCAVGTTIEVRDLFYNTPARMKFLKKDVKEGANVSAVIDRIAVSHPEISFKMVKDGKQTLATQGNGSLRDTVYAVFGKEIALGTLPIEYSANGVSVTGLICKPFKCRPNRNLQLVYLNGRFVKSATAMAALDVGYKNSAMVGKFPYCFLNITVPFETVDVNVHPAKTEVRFADESRVFDAIRYGVKNALAADTSRPQFEQGKSATPAATKLFMAELAADAEKAQAVHLPVKNDGNSFFVAEKPKNDGAFFETVNAAELQAEKLQEPRFKVTLADPKKYDVAAAKAKEQTDFPTFERAGGMHEEVLRGALKNTNIDVYVDEDEAQDEQNKQDVYEQPPRFIGELFKTYILAQQDDKLLLIDKHAAHERILYEQQKSSAQPQSQYLLTAATVTLEKSEYAAIIENASLLIEAGFELEDYGDGTVMLRAVPSMLENEDYTALLSEIAENLTKTGSVATEKLDRIYHTVACKAAVKAGWLSSDEQLKKLMNSAIFDPKIRYCPHGRPVTVEITRAQLERMFGRA